VLLTRSRLCPRPKPGSSLHLHVLGTPPAFVLSQDQTLREELPQRVVRKFRPAGVGSGLCRDRRRVDPGSVPGGIGPLRSRRPPAVDRGASPLRSQTHRPQPVCPLRSRRSGARCTRRAPERKTGSILAPPFRPADETGDGGVEPGHTSRPRFGRRVRMLLSFQRPSHLFGRGILLGGAPGSEARPRGGPTSIALAAGRFGRATKPAAGRARRTSQDTTWTVIVRSRGRSSKSISTSCCHVPSVIRPPTTGIVADGPISAARRCACELESWLSRLCA
jgi:hypothetical protein